MTWTPWRMRPTKKRHNRGAECSTSLVTAGVRGDRLQFPFDGRVHRAALELSNLSGSPLRLRIVFYCPDRGRTLATQTKTIPGFGRLLVSAARVPGVSGHAGVATVTPIGSSEQAVVPAGAGPDQCQPPLLGSYSLPNAGLAAAHARRLAAWSVVEERGRRPAAGTAIDGFVVRYEQTGPVSAAA